MSLKDDLKKKVFDRRLIDKHVADGKIKQSEVEEYLKNLPDDQANYTTTGKAAEERLQQKH